MDSSPLLKFFDEIFEWISLIPIGIRIRAIQTTVSQLHDIQNYVKELGVDSDLISLQMYTKWGLNEVWQGRFDGQSDGAVSRVIIGFLQDLEELFKVPKIRHPPDSDESSVLNKNKLTAVFIGFLFQIQQHAREPVFVDSRVMEELRSLIAILGDTPFQATEDERVQNLWAEFEGLANEAGRLVHSFIFAPGQISHERMKGSLAVLTESIEQFEADVVKFSKSLPNYLATSKANNCRRVNSLFVVDSLVYDLEDLMNQDGDHIVEIKDQIKIVHKGLLLAQSLIKDMNMSQNLKMEELEEPMMQIRDVAYEAEYLIHSFLVGDVPLWYLTIRLNHVIEDIKLIVSRLQEMKANYDIQAFKSGEDSVQQSEQVMGTSKADSDMIIGFEEHESKILNHLLGGRNLLQSVSIFGMPGVGKTTLVKKFYNHPSVACHFDRRAWCVVSQIYRMKSLLTDILICVGSDFDKDTISNMDEHCLAEQIYKSLIGRRYLIVMDDIWNSNFWGDLRRFFPDDGNGSRILFTSRIKNVAPSDSIIYELPILSNDQCWELLEKKVFHDNPCPSQLQEIGKKIAAKCCGLPLTVVVIVGILSARKKDESTWINVARSLDKHFLTDQNSSVMQILKLSYKHLPQHLKPCFLFFGIFKGDEKILIKKLTQLWIAEGFIQQEENKSAQSVAEKYLMELIDKSLVIVVEKRSSGGAKVCVIHDLLHELCLRLAEEENFLTLLHHDYSLYNQKYQHLCIEIFPTTEPTFEGLVPYGPRFRSLFVPLPVVSLSLVNMKLLKILDSKTTWYRDCDLVGTEFLVHLRYLASDCLPASIDKNVNLEFLILHKRVFLSTKILKLAKLRYLSSPEVLFGDDCDTMETSNLEYLFTINIRNLKDEAKLKYFPRLRKLKCRYDMSWKGKRNGAHPCPDFSFLTKCGSLKVTTLNRRLSDIKFPSNIKRLTLSGLRLSWDKMLAIGVLSRLEILKLESAAFSGKTWETTDDKFQQLRCLKMQGLDLMRWKVSSTQHFPTLQRLIVMNCDNLLKIPSEIGDIESLQAIEVRGWCRESVVESGREILQRNQDMGNEELIVIIEDIQIRSGWLNHKTSPSDVENSSTDDERSFDGF